MKSLLEQTLSSLETHKLSPVPDHYRLWFEHSSKSNTDLNNEIDDLIQQQIAINEELCKKLFNKHLASDDHKDIESARLDFGHLLNIMIGQMSRWTNSNDELSDTLNECTRKLNNDPSLEEIKNIVADLSSSTEALAITNNGVSTSLSAVNKEIIKLRKDLAQMGAQAITDSLTGISNRRGMDNKLISTIEDANRQQGDLSIIMIDIDKFKNINDNFGHQVGDKILKFVASIMQKNLRATDYIARYGGEEFIIILPQTNEQGAIQVAEHIRKAVSEKPLSTGGSKSQVIGRVTISLGVAQYRLFESDAAILDRANLCMYAAKNNGRDNVKGEKALNNTAT